MSIYGGSPTTLSTTINVAGLGTVGPLALTGDHIASQVVLAIGLSFLGAGLVRAARRRPHRL